MALESGIPLRYAFFCGLRSQSQPEISVQWTTSPVKRKPKHGMMQYVNNDNLISNHEQNLFEICSIQLVFVKKCATKNNVLVPIDSWHTTFCPDFLADESKCLMPQHSDSKIFSGKRFVPLFLKIVGASYHVFPPMLRSS